MNGQNTTGQFVMTRRERRRYLWFGAALGLGMLLACAVLVNSVGQYQRITDFEERIEAGSRRGVDADRAQTFVSRMYGNLAVNSASALALLGCLIVAGVRFRYHLRAKRWEQQMELARAVQRQLLPLSGRVVDGRMASQLGVAAEFVPASEVGGDLFDVFPVGKDEQENRYGFAVGDVSGKGLPAALLLGVMHGAVRSNRWHDSRLEHEGFAERLNELLHASTHEARFATLVWGTYDADRGLLQYVSAGHCPGLLLRAESGVVERLDSTGPVLGLLRMSRYRQEEVAFSQGDVVVFYSDGVLEAANAEGDQFGEHRLKAVLERCPGFDAARVRAAILNALAQFRGTLLKATEEDDDLTLLVLEARGAEVIQGETKVQGDTEKTSVSRQKRNVGQEIVAA